MPLETWKPIVDFPGYEVSDLGRVRSFRRYKEGKLLKPGNDHWGYPLVVLMKDGRMNTKRVHLLVLETFVGPRPDGMEASHLDNDSGNPKLDNLVWDTHSNNQKHYHTGPHGRR